MTSSNPKQLSVPILWIENAQDDAPVAVVCPGLGMSASKYRKFGETLCRNGFHVSICDLRGQGEYAPRSGRSHDHGMAEIVGDDMTEVLAAVENRFPDSEILLVGHSLGGRIVSLAAARRRASGAPVAGVATVASSTSYFTFFGKRAPLVLFQTAAMKLVTRICGYYPGDRLRFGGIQPPTLMEQWADMAQTGKLRISEMPDAEDLIESLDRPVLVIGLDGDQLAPKAAVDHFAGKFLAAHVTRCEIPSGGHPGRLPHSSWIKRPDGVAAQITQWFSTVTVRAASSS